MHKDRIGLLGAALLAVLALLAAVAAGLAHAGSGGIDASAAEYQYRDGKFTEYTLPNGDYVFHIAAGPDGNLWFTNIAKSAIGRITPTGSLSEFALPTARFPSQIAAGPDGALWFAAQGPPAEIGRITPGGSISEFPLPDANSVPFGIAAGSDGNLWFTEARANRIGRITPAGSITEFAPPVGGTAYGIAAGADGNLWFSDGDRIGRITPAGSITEFALPVPGSQAGSIAAGPDGNLWFVEEHGDRIGRVTPAGVISEFGLAPMANPLGIAAGPDGNLWFTEGLGNRIGRITPAGHIDQFALPSPTGSRGIAAGPDGNVWFTEESSADPRIGRFRTAHADTGYALSLDTGFAPVSREIALDEALQWSFYGPNAHSVADASGMNLFDSGARTMVSFFTFAFGAAGTYPYRDTLQPALNGTVKVPVTLSPASGMTTTEFTVTWASAPPAAGFVSDIQIERPGDSAFSGWMAGQTGTSAVFVPDTGPGTYLFRARLRRSADGTHSRFSPARAIIVT